MRLNGRESPAKPWSDRFLVRRAQHTIREQETADGYESSNATSAGHCFGNAAISIATWAMRRGPIIVGNLFASFGGWDSRSVLASPRGLRATSQCAAFFSRSLRGYGSKVDRPVWLQTTRYGR